MSERPCRRCGELNPADAQFCIDCGAALTDASTGPTTRLPGIVCPACYSHNPDDARFCASCGRSFGPEAPAPAPTPAPAPRPVRPAPSAAPRQSYPRTATPPTLYRPAPPVAPHHHRGARQNPGPIVFLIGLAILLMNGAIWPGILVLIGLSILFTQLARGHTDKAIKAMLWFGGLALMFGSGRFGFGRFMMFAVVIIIVTSLFNSNRRIW